MHHVLPEEDRPYLDQAKDFLWGCWALPEAHIPGHECYRVSGAFEYLIMPVTKHQATRQTLSALQAAQLTESIKKEDRCVGHLLICVSYLKRNVTSCVHGRLTLQDAGHAVWEAKGCRSKDPIYQSKRQDAIINCSPD